MSALPSDFATLPPLEKRQAVEEATGLTWAQYSSLSASQQNALLNSLKGNTFESATDDMLGAAKSDSFWSGVGGYFSGMGAGLKIALLLAVVIAAYLALPILKKLPRLAKGKA